MDGKASPAWPGPANRQVGLSAGHPAGRGSALVWPREARDPVLSARLAQGTPGPWQLRTLLELAALPSAVPSARLHARQVLWEWGLSAITDTAELLLSELVTNSVKAAQATDHNPPLRVRLSANRVRLLVEVWDGNTHPPVPRELENDVAALDAEVGRGLFLVETLSERWGWYPTRNPEGKVTWCELDAPEADRPGQITVAGPGVIRRTGGDMERALITGVAGFIGSHLAAELLRRGWLVTGVDTRSPASDPVAAENLAELTRGDGRFQFVQADVSGSDLTMLLEGARVVFHLAALPGVRRSWGDRFADYLTCNVLGTQRLLEACAMVEVPRLVFASSSSVYGPTNGTPSREADSLVPLSPYGVSKLAAERLCLAYASHPGAVTSVVALRYFTVYGPRQRPDMAFSRIMRAARSGHAVSLYGTGEQRRDFTYVSDAVNATIAAATVDAQAEVVNVGSGSSVTLADVLESVAAFAGALVPVLRRVTQPGDVNVTSADLARARQLLGYEPQVSLADGLRRQWEQLASREHRAAPVAAEVAT
jgi:UDP-glucuronate 4-epimerase